MAVISKFNSQIFNRTLELLLATDSQEIAKEYYDCK